MSSGDVEKKQRNDDFNKLKKPQNHRFSLENEGLNYTPLAELY